MSEPLAWSFGPDFYLTARVILIGGGTVVAGVSGWRLARFLKSSLDPLPEVEEPDREAEPAGEEVPAEIGDVPEPEEEPVPVPADPAPQELPPRRRRLTLPPQPSPRLPFPPPVSPFRDDLLALLSATPRARTVCDWFELPAPRALAGDGAAQREALLVLACWDWLKLVGTPEGDLRFVLAQLGRGRSEPEQRLARLFAAVGEIVPHFIADGASRRASEVLVAGLAGSDAALLWPQPGDMFDQATHVSATPHIRKIVARLASPGFGIAGKTVQPATVRTAAAAERSAEVESGRKAKAPFLDLFSVSAVQWVAADANRRRGRRGAPAGKRPRLKENDMSDTIDDPAAAGSDILVVACPTDGSLNRVPRAKLDRDPKCGRCLNPLFQGKAVVLSAANFDKHVLKGDLPVVIDFWAKWCGPCRMMSPAFEAAAKQLEPRVRLAKLDTEAEPAIAGRYAIRGIPSMILIAKGREIARTSGAMPAAAIVQWVERTLARP